MADGATDLDLARSGDRAAFGRLVMQYQRRIYATALHLLGNHADADDVTQETFVRAYRALESFDGRSELFTWLYRIAVNTSLNFMRSGRRANRLGLHGGAEVDHLGGRPEALGVVERDPEQRHEVSQEVARVLEAVAALSPPLRVTLILSVVEELSHREVAELLDVPEGTVGWRISEARRLLRLRLAAEAASRDGAGASDGADGAKDQERARPKRGRQDASGRPRPAGEPS